MFFESHLRGDDGTLLAIVKAIRNPLFDGVESAINGSSDCRDFLNAVRSIPFDAVTVTVTYPRLHRSVIINQNLVQPEKELFMDLSHLYADRPVTKIDALPQRMLAPLPNVVPEDSIVTYTTVETLKDVLDAPPQAVLLFAEDRMELLEVVVAHPQLVGFTSYVLSGLPTADYNAAFESKTYTLERVAYPSLINDLIERKRTAEALADERATPYERERRQFTRKSGGVKELTGVRIAGQPDQEEDADAGAE